MSIHQSTVKIHRAQANTYLRHTSQIRLSCVLPAENVPLTPLVSFVCKRRAEKKEERRRRELERRKEEARVVKAKAAKEKARDKDRHDSKEMPKVRLRR